MAVWSAVGPLVGVIIGGAITWAQQGRANKHQSEREWNLFLIQTVSQLQDEINAADAYLAKLNAQLKLARAGKMNFEHFDVPMDRFNQISGLSSRLENVDLSERIRVWAAGAIERATNPDNTAEDADAKRMGTERMAIIDELGKLLRTYYARSR